MRVFMGCVHPFELWKERGVAASRAAREDHDDVIVIHGVKLPVCCKKPQRTCPLPVKVAEVKLGCLSLLSFKNTHRHPVLCHWFARWHFSDS